MRSPRFPHLIRWLAFILLLSSCTTVQQTGSDPPSVAAAPPTEVGGRAPDLSDASGATGSGPPPVLLRASTPTAEAIGTATPANFVAASAEGLAQPQAPPPVAASDAVPTVPGLAASTLGPSPAPATPTATAAPPTPAPTAPPPSPTVLPAPARPAQDSAPAKREAGAKRVVALDPGHGGPEVGAAAPGLVEKELNLRIALKLAPLLRELGYAVILTRESDRAVSPDYQAGFPGVARDLQARIDIANGAGANLFLSIHNNGSADAGQAGTEVWYSKQRDFSDRNLAFANLIQRALLRQLREIGYRAFDRGIKDDSAFRIFRGQPYNIYVLGPGDGARRHEPTRMPGALGESLILSNPADAAMLRQDRTLDAIAAGYRDAIVAYFEQFP